MPGICCADGCDNSSQRKPRYTIDTIMNNCCVLLELNSPEQARVLITSKLFSPLGFGYNSLAHIGTLACSGEFLYSLNLWFMGMDSVRDKWKCREKKVGADALQKHRGIANH